MLVLPLDQRKELAIALFVTYRHRQKMGILDAAQEAASVTGFNERTVRRFWDEWSSNGGCFMESSQGKYDCHQTLLDDEDFRGRALAWINMNAVKEGQGNMTARSLICQVCQRGALAQHLPSAWFSQEYFCPYS